MTERSTEETPQQKLARIRAEFAAHTPVNPFSEMVETICGVTFVNETTDIHRKRRSDKVKIAFVSMPPVALDDVVEHSSLHPGCRGATCPAENGAGTTAPEGVDPRALKRVLASFKPATAERMFNEFREALEAAVERFHPDVICFNELGLPAEDFPLSRAIDLAWDMSDKHNMLVIAGSAHDSRTLYNTGYVFRPGGPRPGQGFHKSISARAVGELISAPASRRVAAVYFAGLRIAMMICIDVADYASIASVVKVGDGVDVLLVPCYTPKIEDMNSIAKVTSNALPGIVALVNANDPDGVAKPCLVASFGSSKALTPALKLPSGVSISILDIDLAEFQQTRLSMTNDSNRSDVAFLFGRRDMPSVS